MRRKAKIPKAIKEPGVLSGNFVFYFIDTIGLPLEMVIIRAQQYGMFIDWPGFASKAVSCGWGKRRLDACRRLADNYYTEMWVEKTFGYKRGGNV